MRAINLVSSTAVLVTAGFMLVAGSAMAASPSEQECIASGGTFEKVQGTDVCVTSGTKDVNGNAFGTETTTTTTGQGNIDNKTATSCTGNNGQCKQ